MIENSLKIGNYKPRREVGEPTVSSALKILALLVVLLVFPLSASASARLQMPPNYLTTGSGLVGYWTFDGKDTNWGTNTTNDLSGQGNTLTMMNMSTTTSPVSGKIGQAMNLNVGTNFLKQTGNPSSLKFTSPQSFSYGGWFKPMSDTADSVMDWNAYAGNDILYDRYFLHIDNQGGPGSEGITCSVNLTTTDVSALWFQEVKTGQWYHLFCTYDDTAKVVRTYINGVLGQTSSVGSGTLTSDDGGSGAQTLVIGGGAPGGVGRTSINNISDDVRIYNRALSAAEVANLYNIGKAKANVSNTIISNGLVGYWTFDGATTTWSSATAGITGDLSGNFNTGTLTNMNRATSPAVGKIGQGLKFDGVDDYASAPDASLPNGNSALSVSAWINPTVKTDYEYILNYGTNTSNNAVQLAVSATYGIVASFGGAGCDALPSLATSISVNKWQLVTITKASASSVVNFYINGVLAATITPSSCTPNIILNTLNIGRSQSANNYYNGTIDDVRIYNRALSAGEVAQLYQQGAAKVNKSPTSLLPSGLVGYWTFDGATTTWSSATAGITGDLSGNFNTGTLTNMNRATSPTIGKIGQGLKFDGVDDNITTNDSASLDITSQLTISGWAKHSGVATYPRIVEKSKDSTVCTDPYVIYSLDFDNVGLADLSIAVGGLLKSVKSASAPSLNTWHHYTGTYDGANMKIYVDGVLSNTVAQTGAIDTSNVGLIFGSSRLASPCGTGVLTGSIDDVRIYNRALSANEVKQLYNIGR